MTSFMVEYSKTEEISFVTADIVISDVYRLCVALALFALFALIFPMLIKTSFLIHYTLDIRSIYSRLSSIAQIELIENPKNK